ncbi:hypothetical protein ABL78_7316 [Leptomonas seymouri]|uniref:Uncharacterized protein n=1 Tax=Leptomonas seymouri TaxID=5684 RepID=A0A0N1I0T3_LEPSE|nr:hypothetical protein ABL78_7316 [Leptomonas seymouri]|eukprot:KPI83644.1 hypothetical protein ABL78_7316 [Leptomonas seymouri]
MLRSSRPALRVIARAAPNYASAVTTVHRSPRSSAVICAKATAGRSIFSASSLWTCSRFFSAATRCLHAPKHPHIPIQENNDAGLHDEAAFNFEFDPLDGVRHDAAVETAKKSVDNIVEELAPLNAPAEALAKIRTYLVQHPVDALILHPEVLITHIENPDTGAEDRVHLSPMDIKSALEQAQLRKMNLVQMGARGNELAYCRIRRERPWILKMVQAEMEQAGGMMGDPAAIRSPSAAVAGATTAAAEGEVHAPASSPQQHPPQYIGKTKPLIDHPFRDAVDAHFIGWRSKKIVQDIRKGHAVKVTIKEFQSPESAIIRLREMCNAMKAYAETEHVYHHFTSIVANDREASIAFSPPTANKSGTMAKSVRHPTEKEWVNALKRMEDACQKAGRLGTYMKTNKLKMRNMGASLYRVDKYGRRVS